MSGDFLATDGVVVRVATIVARVAVEGSVADGGDEVRVGVHNTASTETSCVESSYER